MSIDVVMPRLSDSMEEGTILTWLKRPGEEVAIGEELVEIETDKANMAYESDRAGTLLEILVPAGEVAAIGEPIARIGASGEAGSPEPTNGSVAPADESGARVKASPLARRLAAGLGVDLGALRGTGPGGRVVKADVEAASSRALPTAGSDGEATPGRVGGERAETAKGEVEVVVPTRLQEVVARRMSESKATAPHFYLQAEIEMSAAVAARATLKSLAKEGEVVPSYNDMVIKACALALREFPKANGSYRDARVELYSRINVGVAVAAEDALLVPTIFDADDKGLRQIAGEARALAGRVRDGSITPPELAGGTFTVSNLGMYGIRSFQAIVNAPQAAILAVGEIVERPLVRDGEIVVGQVMEASLSCDHRILYGAEGAGFLSLVRSLLEEPVALAL